MTHAAGPGRRRHPVAPVAWYLAVAGFNAVFYFSLCEGLSRLGLAPSTAAAAALAPVLAVSYLGHKAKTFKSRGAHVREAPRFLVLAAADFALAGAAPVVAALAQAPRWTGFAALTVLIPLLNFGLMRLWVFRSS